MRGLLEQKRAAQWRGRSGGVLLLVGILELRAHRHDCGCFGGYSITDCWGFEGDVTFTAIKARKRCFGREKRKNPWRGRVEKLSFVKDLVVRVVLVMEFLQWRKSQLIKSDNR